MTTYVCCHKCGVMSLNVCADGWRTLNGGDHHCVECVAKEILKKQKAKQSAPAHA